MADPPPPIETHVIVDLSAIGSRPHRERRAYVVRRLTAARSEGGLGLTMEAFGEVIANTTTATCENLFKTQVAPNKFGVPPHQVGHEFFYLAVWRQIFVDRGIADDFPWERELFAAFEDLDSARSSEYARYYARFIQKPAQDDLARRLGSMNLGLLPAPPAAEPQASEPGAMSPGLGMATTAASAATSAAPPARDNTAAGRPALAAVVVPAVGSPPAGPPAPNKGHGVEHQAARSLFTAPAPPAGPSAALKGHNSPFLRPSPVRTEGLRTASLAQAETGGADKLRSPSWPFPKSEPLSWADDVPDPEPERNPFTVPGPTGRPPQPPVPSGLAQSAWATVPPRPADLRPRAPLVTGVAPAALTVPGMAINANNQRAQERREERVASTVRGLQEQSATARADAAFRGYSPPAYRMPVETRLSVWRHALGSQPLPDAGIGPLELALPSREWCFERCYGPGGKVREQTLTHAINRKCTIWFEAGPDGRPFTKLVVGLRQQERLTDYVCNVLLEAWLNIRLWRDSGSNQHMHNGVGAIRREAGPNGVLPRVMNALSAAGAPPAPAAPVASAATGTRARPAQLRQPPRQQNAAPRQFETIEHGQRWQQAVKDLDNEIPRINAEVTGRIGTNRSPAEVTQAMTSWFRDARSPNRSRIELAMLGAQAWFDAYRSLDHRRAALIWQKDMFPDSVPENWEDMLSALEEADPLPPSTVENPPVPLHAEGSNPPVPLHAEGSKPPVPSHAEGTTLLVPSHAEGGNTPAPQSAVGDDPSVPLSTEDTKPLAQQRAEDDPDPPGPTG